ncbi:MAG TPA: phosphotransferase [Amycolatopsis sp.]|uniref:phosphotransferase enzyme family protein n=1 Tax=Amycolatopsis sp. TaxID=37632 RepID=UPI002B485BD4|nr:phosphotransferase [Amycolatopsis sp.]HKS44594.1 phosphotransferase [Amycolatopsis sp.]
MAESALAQAIENERAETGFRVLAQALPHFGIEADAPVQLLPQSENVALRVHPAHRPPVVVRISPPGARTHEELKSEIAWITALKRESDAPVAGVLTSDAGEAVVRVADPTTGTVLSVVVFEHVRGHEPAEDELAALMPLLGRISAQLHQHSATWARPDWFCRGRWDADAAFGDRPRWGRWQVAVPDPGQRQLLDRLERVVSGRLQRFGADRDRFGLIHADLRTANLLVDGETCHLIDFDDAGFGWWLYDLATALTFYENHPDRDELIGAWVRAYREIRDLPDEDESEIPTFLMLRRLLTLAFLGSNPGIDVSRQMLAGLPEQTCELAEDYLRQFD